MQIIKIINGCKSFKNLKVLTNINISLESNNLYLLVGENGSGKSTIIKILLGLYKKSSGDFYINEKSIGYIPEKISFPEYVSVYDFLYNLGMIRKMNIRSLDNIIRLLAKEWKIEEYLGYRFNQLSKGMIQKILIIQAVMHSPNLYILDEPLNGLDKIMQLKLISMIENLIFFKKTIIIITHYPNDFIDIANYVINTKNNMLIINKKENYEKSNKMSL